jgi:ATP-dependent Clp endopeptidase proteolytic subunit ClpP
LSETKPIQMPKGTLRIRTVRNIGWGFNDADLEEQLSGFSGNRIEVPINSYGGDVFSGLAAYNLLRGRSEKINTKILGIAASMGTILSASGSSGMVEMPENGYYMIHNPKGGNYSESEKMASFADLLRQMELDMANIYRKRTQSAGQDISLETIQEWMRKEKWFNAEAALKYGFVDKLTDGVKLSAHVNMDELKGLYSNVPDTLLSKNYYQMGFKDQFKALADGFTKLVNSMEEEGTGGTEGAKPDAEGQAPENTGGQDSGKPEGKPESKAEGEKPNAEAPEVSAKIEKLEASVSDMKSALETVTETFKAAQATMASMAKTIEDQKKANAALKQMVVGKSEGGKNTAPAAAEAMAEKTFREVTNEAEFG